MTASSEQEFAAASRARLNAATLTPIVEALSEGFSGGWQPLTNDTELWLQVWNTPRLSLLSYIVSGS